MEEMKSMVVQWVHARAFTLRHDPHVTAETEQKRDLINPALMFLLDRRRIDGLTLSGGNICLSNRFRFQIFRFIRWTVMTLSLIQKVYCSLSQFFEGVLLIQIIIQYIVTSYYFIILFYCIFIIFYLYIISLHVCHV